MDRVNAWRMPCSMQSTQLFVSHGTAAAFAWASASVWCRSVRTVKALRASCAPLTPPATPQRSRPQRIHVYNQADPAQVRHTHIDWIDRIN